MRRWETFLFCLILNFFSVASALTPKPLFLEAPFKVNVVAKTKEVSFKRAKNYVTEKSYILPSMRKKQKMEVSVMVGEAKILPVWDLGKVIIGDPSVVDVKPLSDHELMLLGKKQGRTNLIIWEGSVRSNFTIKVVPQVEGTPQAEQEKIEIISLENQWLRKYEVDFKDTKIEWTFSEDAVKIEALKKSIGLLIPEGKFVINPKLNTVTVRGTEKEIAVVKKFLKKWDRKVKQIILETRLMEVFTQDMRNIGLTGTTQNSRGQFTQDLGTGTLTIDSLGAFSEQYLLKIKALEEKNKARLLANPKIVEVVGEDHWGTIFLGDSLPIKTTSTSTSGVTTESVSYIDVGIQLVIVPFTIEKDGSIRLNIVVESTTVKGMSQGNPIITGRTANSEVRVKDGETFVLGGLIQERDVKDLKQVPFLSKLPILGNLFKSMEKTKEKTEVIAVITPHVIE